MWNRDAVAVRLAPGRRSAASIAATAVGSEHLEIAQPLQLRDGSGNSCAAHAGMAGDGLETGIGVGAAADEGEGDGVPDETGAGS